MPVQSDSIIYYINYTKTLEGTKFTHIYLVLFQEKNPTKEQVTKLKMKQQTNKQGPVLTYEEKKENKTHSPQLQTFIVLRIQKSH